MAFGRMGMHPINSTKNIAEASGILAAVTNTVIGTLVDSVDAATLADTNGVEKNSSINSIFLSTFFVSEGGEVASEVPLVDWYILINRGGKIGSTFGSTGALLPIPGSQGLAVNKNAILHSEKGLTGGGDASLAGVPMVFKGVIKIPRSMRRMIVGTQILICARANFNTKFCLQAIYKWYK